MAYEKMPFFQISDGVKKIVGFGAKSAQHQGVFKSGKNSGQPYWVWHLIDGGVKHSFFAPMAVHDVLVDLASRNDEIEAVGHKGYTEFRSANGVPSKPVVKPTVTVPTASAVKPTAIVAGNGSHEPLERVRSMCLSYAKDMVIGGKASENSIFDLTKRFVQYITTGDEYLKEEKEVIEALERPSKKDQPVSQFGLTRGTGPDEAEFKDFLSTLRAYCMVRHPGKPEEQFKETQALMTGLLTQYFGKASIFLMEDLTKECRDELLKQQDGQFLNWAKEEIEKQISGK